jgi:hypothetical protein
MAQQNSVRYRAAGLHIVHPVGRFADRLGYAGGGIAHLRGHGLLSFVRK